MLPSGKSSSWVKCTSLTAWIEPNGKSEPHSRAIRWSKLCMNSKLLVKLHFCNHELPHVRMISRCKICGVMHLGVLGTSKCLCCDCGTVKNHVHFPQDVLHWVVVVFAYNKQPSTPTACRSNPWMSVSALSSMSCKSTLAAELNSFCFRLKSTYLLL